MLNPTERKNMETSIYLKRFTISVRLLLVTKQNENIIYIAK